MGSGPPSKAPEARYERFLCTFPSGTAIEAFYPTGATLREAQVGHALAKVAPVEESRIEADSP
jgi:hypothetical protein